MDLLEIHHHFRTNLQCSDAVFGGEGGVPWRGDPKLEFPQKVGATLCVVAVVNAAGRFSQNLSLKCPVTCLARVTDRPAAEA